MRAIFATAILLLTACPSEPPDDDTGGGSSSTTSGTTEAVDESTGSADATSTGEPCPAQTDTGDALCGAFEGPGHDWRCLCDGEEVGFDLTCADDCRCGNARVNTHLCTTTGCYLSNGDCWCDGMVVDPTVCTADVCILDLNTFRCFCDGAWALPEFCGCATTPGGCECPQGTDPSLDTDCPAPP